MEGASLLSETVVSVLWWGLASLACECCVWLCSLSVACSGCMHSLLSGRPMGNWDGVPESHTKKFKF